MKIKGKIYLYNLSISEFISSIPHNERDNITIIEMS